MRVHELLHLALNVYMIDGEELIMWADGQSLTNINIHENRLLTKYISHEINPPYTFHQQCMECLECCGPLSVSK